MILERRDRTPSGETTKPALYDPNSPKRNVKVLRSTPTTTQEQQQKRPIIKKQPTSSSSSSAPLDRQETSLHSIQQPIISNTSCTPFFRRNDLFNTESITQVLTDNPGHYVVGVVGQQGVGKSSILSSFTEQSTNTFPSQPNDLFLSLGHKTSGIDMHICPERMILLDTEPILSWTVMERALRHHTADGSHPDAWLEMDALYNLVFLLSVCNVVIVVFDGTELDINMIHCLQRAEMLKFQLPEFPLISPSNLGQAQQDMNYYPDIVFVCNKCHSDDFTLTRYQTTQTVIEKSFHDSQLKIRGIGSLGNILPAYKLTSKDQDPPNLYFLPYSKHLWSGSTSCARGMDDDRNGAEAFEMIVMNLRNHIMAGPRRTGKKGQISEKEWFRNAVKLYEMVRNSDYIAEYMKSIRKLRDG
ncbi:hypothetical protein BC941DRAFT_436363 [Chlamydoabsidia padenii]|nr:hypothetical protein BC941DRAFT_436363 [Chlamydoabsidia padenii]